MPPRVDGVQVSMVVPDRVTSGNRVPLVIRLTNVSASPIELYLRGREITFDIVITDASGSEVWRLLQGDPIPAILQLRALAPGEALELTHEWDQQTRRGGQAAEGRYTVRAEVLTDGSGSLESDEAVRH